MLSWGCWGAGSANEIAGRKAEKHIVGSLQLTPRVEIDQIDAVTRDFILQHNEIVVAERVRHRRPIPDMGPPIVDPLKSIVG